MSPKLKNILSWVAIAIGLGLYAWLSIRQQENEAREEQSDRIRDEVAESVGKSLAESSRKRNEKLKEDLKALMKKDAGLSAPPPSSPPDPR